MQAGALQSAQHSTEVYRCVLQAAHSLIITIAVRGDVVTYGAHPLLIRQQSERWLMADGIGRSLVLDKETGNFGFSFVYREADDTIFGNYVRGICTKSGR
jgi:hypothetical protein